MPTALTGSRTSRWLRLRSGVADRVIATVLLAVTGPPLAALLGWVRVRDGSPAVIRLTRVGTHGRPFGMWKVRTMTVGRDGGRAGGAALTAAEDVRVTPTGRRIRRHRLDELPQLVNVIAGDMALIGSRPEDPHLHDPDDPSWDGVLDVPPAITGATQLVVHEWEEQVMAGADDHVACYRTEVLPVKLAIDRWYVESASPALDATIAWSMVQRFVLRRTVTAIDRRVRRELPVVAADLAAGARR